MKAFSFRRMWRFCRLLLEQICFYSFGKAAAVMLAVIVFCCLLPLLAVDGAIQEKMSVTEDLIKVLVMFMLSPSSERRASARMRMGRCCMRGVPVRIRVSPCRMA